MKSIKLVELSIENFKGIREKTVNFQEDTTVISGRNASGKTTLMDAFFWLLFGKDSQGRADFQIRPVDENGMLVDNIEILVEGALDVDGTEVVLTKKQVQKWTKHRGSSAPTFEGNVNSFQVDGFPVSQKEFAEKVSSIVSEDLFRLLTSPMAFASQKWQDQRRILMRMVEDVSDEDLLNSDEMYGPIKADVLAAGVDKAKEKAATALKKLKEEQKAFPIRIDEASKSIVEVDVDALTEKKKTLQVELETVMAEKDGLVDNSASIRKLNAEIMQAKLDADGVKFDRESKLREAKKEVSARLTAKQEEVDGIRRGIHKGEGDCELLAKRVADAEMEIAELTEKYKKTKARVLPENATVCPTCGRELPADDAEKIRKDFEERKHNDLVEILERGNMTKQSRDANRSKASEMTKSLATLSDLLGKSESELDAIKAEYRAIPTEPDMTHDEEYIACLDKISKLQEQLDDIRSHDDGTDTFVERIRSLKESISAVDAELSAVDANERARSRIADLQEAQRDNSQMVADQEQVVYLIEEFIKLKMNTISGHINAKFKNVRFKLFEQLINGGMKETCVMQVNSNGSYVDYGNANHAAQILGGLDVIDALSELYGVEAPVLIDNAECLDTQHQPKSHSQLILLKVSDDKDLTIKKGE
jgi:predicted  nucleic acid-binding Zn-ribbon protein